LGEGRDKKKGREEIFSFVPFSPFYEVVPKKKKKKKKKGGKEGGRGEGGKTRLFRDRLGKRGGGRGG